MPKQIKDFELKEAIDGSEDLLIQDSDGITKRIKTSKLIDNATGDITREEVNTLLQGKANVSHTHVASQVSGLSTVATSGSYNDLTNKPTIPTIPTSLPANGGNADTVNNFNIVALTQSEYDALSSKDNNTLYIIKG